MLIGLTLRAIAVAFKRPRVPQLKLKLKPGDLLLKLPDRRVRTFDSVLDIGEARRELTARGSPTDDHEASQDRRKCARPLHTEQKRPAEGNLRKFAGRGGPCREAEG